MPLCAKIGEERQECEAGQVAVGGGVAEMSGDWSAGETVEFQSCGLPTGRKVNRPRDLWTFRIPCFVATAAFRRWSGFSAESKLEA
jgi:hypothetical protein